MRRLLLTVLATACLLLAGAQPSSAHDRLLRTAPADGEQLATAPAEVRLEFSAPVLGINPQVVLRDATGATVTTPAAVADGSAVTLALPGPLAAGGYTVLWRVVSSDGHPIEDGFGFTVAGTATPTATPSESATATPTATPSESATATPSATPSESATASATPTSSAGSAGDGGGTDTALIAVGGAVAAATGIVGVLLALRRSRTDAGRD
ncbi:copper resistance CopC family protein [Kineococcus glutinatus]|uniref:CopC domain-containing protein n=1 Tax=Kineococcus glutinatus TaxID=1070872 RepID=A0ABP9HAU3_9ACTN